MSAPMILASTAGPATIAPGVTVYEVSPDTVALVRDGRVQALMETNQRNVYGIVDALKAACLGALPPDVEWFERPDTHETARPSR